MLRMLISPKTLPSLNVANTVLLSSATTFNFPFLTMYISLPISPCYENELQINFKAILLTQFWLLIQHLLKRFQNAMKTNLSANVVSRTENGQFQFEHKFDKKTRFTILKDGHSPQSFKMYVHGDLGFEFVW
jgi:hypothetical protein